ncbi:MAG: DNA cytosine methyltransferase [Alphaproteobacteria bacterium]|nr:DNA cytosine methyltransferase [Alphaproteobacteria bacterium]
MRYLSVCSGIEAATQAWHPLGWQPVAFSEIEPFPSAVLAHHYPSVPNLGDMTKFKEWPNEPVDLLVGGTPCQSFSVAGLRQGLADPRGNLALTYLAIAAKYRPKWVVWENVPGVYSATSHNAPDPCPPEIDLDGDDGPEVGEEVVVTDEYDSDEDHAFSCFLAGLQELGYGVAYRALDAQHVRTRRFPWAVPQRRRRVFVVGYLGDWRRAAAVLFDRESLSGDPAPRREAGQSAAKCLTRGACQRLDWETEDFIPEVAGTMKSCAQSGGFSNSADHAAAGYMVPVAGAICRDSFSSGAGGRPEGAAAGHFPPISFGAKMSVPQVDFDVNQTLQAENPMAVAFDMRGREGGAMPEGPHDTANIRAASGGSSRSYVAQPMAVRRLTPIECERLQGFPDDFTRIPYRNKPADQCPDGPRYKALGNSMAVNCMEWIGERIALVDSMEAAA